MVPFGFHSVCLCVCVCVCVGGGGDMGTINGLVKHILQSVFFCVQQKKINFTLKLNFK